VEAQKILRGAAAECPTVATGLSRPVCWHEYHTTY